VIGTSAAGGFSLRCADDVAGTPGYRYVLLSATLESVGELLDHLPVAASPWNPAARPGEPEAP
jgi:hypothetical protein